MRNIIVVSLLLFGLISFAQESNKMDAKGLKQGEWKKYYKNGMLRYVGNFKNDKPQGEFKYYTNKGKLQSKLNHIGSTSYFIAFYSTGEAKSVGRFINQKRDSTWNYYDLDGYKISSDYFIVGLKNRVSYNYFQNGKTAEEKEFMNDFENGKWIQYYEDGKKKMEAIYKDGSLEGKATYYRSDGKRSVSGFYYHGTRNGVWLYFEEGGTKILKKEEYKNGERIDKNKDDKIEVDPLKPISEDFLDPSNVMQQMGGNH